MTDPSTTGFAEVPWDVHSANGGELGGLPSAPPDFDGRCCKSVWNGPTDEPGDNPWLCTRPDGHSGTHRAGNGTQTLAEWS